nr:nitrilase-related carbon-nitrogen hydrolase [Verrucomicrobium spinosum]
MLLHPWGSGYRVWDTKFGRIGVLVCWDQWYPEAARLTAMAGAQILFYPTAIGWLKSEKDSSAPPSIAPGKRCSVAMPWPMAATSLR